MNNEVRLVRRGFFIALIVAFSLMVASGIFILITKTTKPILYDDIYIRNYTQHETLRNIDKKAYPGEQTKYEVRIYSILYESVKYSVKIEPKTRSEYDKYLYVSILDRKGKSLVNNTLEQIYKDGIYISNTITSHGKDCLTFSYTISPELTTSFNFDFNVNFYAEGKVVY